MMRSEPLERQPDFFKNSYESTIMDKSYPNDCHPCWADSREGLWERIHLPVAAGCNVRCGFCETFSSSCHTSQPAYSDRVISVSEAMSIVELELKKRPNLRIIAVSGPGEPLLNGRALEVFERIRERHEDFEFCLSTNGTLLEGCSRQLADLGTKTVTVSVSTHRPETAAMIYEWGRFNGMRLQGLEMGRTIVTRQLRGIDAVVDAGIMVKVNSVLIPGINDNDIRPLARRLSEHGVSLHNIIPLIPLGRMKDRRAPTQGELETLRSRAAEYLPQFTHCKQCRSDVVGIPGEDTPI
ncbi:radical SAM protein [Candidatus Thorarchaeota archaeon]|nr:MAG: radical SAM protein [Candidatus Thorarchaeota archaeon]